MTKLLNTIAILICKLLIKVGKLMGKNGSSAPGKIAMKISPTLLKTLASQVKGEIILVCGTNGKTTTNNLIYSLLSDSGKKVICNNLGANMLPGVACAFISKASLWGKLDADYASIECDEASLRHIVKHIVPDKIVITNLFRDQMDRYGEIEGTIKLLNEAIENVSETTLVLNADDPFCTQFGYGKKAIYYGVSENVIDGNKDENHFCHRCGSTLKYEFRHYDQLGKYECEKCGFIRPNPNYSATRVNTSEGLSFVLSYKGTQHKLKVNYRGFYNLYNILASFAIYESIGGDVLSAQKIFDAYKPQLGRMESFNILGKTVILNLAKNPAGFNQAISTVCMDKRSKNILIAVNDMASDGTDISWLWDVDFDKLKAANVNNIYVAGTRMYDAALRLKYAGFENVITTPINEDSLKDIISKESEVCYMLVNYTVLFDTQNILKTLEEK